MTGAADARPDIQRMVGHAKRVVEAHVNERVPAFRVVLATPQEMAETEVGASGRQGPPAARVQYLKDSYSDMRTTIGAALPGLVMLHAGKVRRASPEELWRTITHELVHVVQFGRPGTLARWYAGQLHNLGVAVLPDEQANELNRLAGADEDEAYAAEEALASRWPEAGGQPASTRVTPPASAAGARSGPAARRASPCLQAELAGDSRYRAALAEGVDTLEAALTMHGFDRDPALMNHVRGLQEAATAAVTGADGARATLASNHSHGAEYHETGRDAHAGAFR